VGIGGKKWSIVDTSVAKGHYAGTFTHSFDAKGRITVPSEWRSELHEKHLFVLPSGEKALKIYPASWIARQQESLHGFALNDPRRKAWESLMARSQNINRQDEQGRVIIREDLRAWAGLKKAALLLGCADHFEIWRPELRQEQAGAEMTFEQAAQLIGI
jgi:MraZ protein